MKKTILKLSAASVGVLGCVNQYIDSYAEKIEPKSRLKYYNWEHGSIFYTVSGSGKPLLLIHDLNVFSSGNDWTETAKILSKYYKVYTIDLPGCGKSDKPAITYTNYYFVQMITSFIKNMIQEKTIVVSSGISSSFVLMADSMDDDLIDGIHMIDPPSLNSLKKQPDQRSKILTTLFKIPVIGRTCYYIATNRTNTEYYLSEKCFYNPFHMKQYHVKAAYQASHYQKGKGRYLYASLEGNYVNTDITRVLKNRNKKTVLVISEGEHDAKEIAKNYRKINEAIAIKPVKNAKKLPQLEVPEEICGIILNEKE
ncbi:MAG: alpha/beta hydrolase [Lachnospiraceae bacterium]|nr:alpha/beta hydrolase [Lachnospiraceae bacterium]